jgi:hypothetical protein
MLIPVETNVYCIPERLKEIDPDFYVVFNTETQKFELHRENHTWDTLELNIPYDELDARTIELVKKNKIENAKKIFAEIDKHNEMLQKKRWEEAIDEANQKAKEIYRYAAASEHREVVPEEDILRW